MKNCCLALLLGFVGFSLVAQELVQTRVNLTSEPSGAAIFIDGRAYGTTPRMLFDLAAGPHLIKYSLSGYVEKDFLLKVSAASPMEHHEILEEEKGLLLLKTDPEGCNIKIDGLSVGETPRFISKLTTKDVHRIVFSKTGYQSQAIQVHLKGRDPVVREEKLVLDSGVLDCVTDPAGAEVMVNGIVRGTSPLLIKNIPKGTAVVKFRLAGYKKRCVS